MVQSKFQLTLLLSVALYGHVPAIASDTWLDIQAPPIIEPGTALDFSSFRPSGNVSAGTYGRLIAVDEHFEFEKLPGVEQRFYGMNTTGSMNTPEYADAVRFAGNAARLGYNAIRIHHHDDEITIGDDGTTLDPDAMRKLDGLVAACIDQGIYISTDLYVSRRHIPWRVLGIDRDGNCGGDLKLLAQFHEGAYSNYIAFARNFLGHENVYTGRAYAKEPALAWVSLINEGALTQFSPASFTNHVCYTEAWGRWVNKRKASNPEVWADIDEALPTEFKDDDRQTLAFRLFLEETEERFVARVTRFLREEMECHALVTDMNGVHHPASSQLARARTMDYVDEHFYVGGPWFFAGGFDLPSRSRMAHVNYVRSPNDLVPRVVFHRVFGKLFTVTEFNYPAPDDCRAAAGLICGSLAALQGWAGVWRFAWSHSDKALSAPERKSMYYMDVSGDPVQLASERAAVCLFLRGDLAPHAARRPVTLSARRMRELAPPFAPYETADTALAWRAQVGTSLGDEEFAPDFAGLDDGPVLADASNGVFTVASPRTCGGFSDGGGFHAGALNVELPSCTGAEAASASGKAAFHGAFAAIWASTLDGEAFDTTRRILVTHMTDVRQTGMEFEEQGEAGRDLIGWGHLPHRIRAGKAGIALKVAPGRWTVFALNPDGTRAAVIPCIQPDADGLLRFEADIARDPAHPAWLYECVMEAIH